MTSSKEEIATRIAEGYPSRPLAELVASAIVDPEHETLDARAPKIVGITGYARHGKNTVGERFEAQGFRQFAFADALKSMALALNPIITVIDFGASFEERRLSDLVSNFGWEYAKSNPEVRRFLQVLGTEGVRDHLGEDSWVNALELEVRKSGAKRVVITDVRFPNEANWVHSRGGRLIRVVRLNPDGTDFENGVDKTHPSEKFVDTLPDDALIAARDLESLNAQADSIIGQILFGGTS